MPVQKRAPAARRVPIAGALGALLASALLSSCSGSSTGSKASPSGARPGTCTFVARLDAIADSVAQADVHDPTAFKRTLDTAVHEYVTNVRELRAVAPVDLHDGLERVEADVQQYRFDAALTDSAALDAYAARSCGRAPSTVTTRGPTVVPDAGAGASTSSTGG